MRSRGGVRDDLLVIAACAGIPLTCVFDLGPENLPFPFLGEFFFTTTGEDERGLSGTDLHHVGRPATALTIGA